MFSARVSAHTELRLLEERHAPAVFALVNQDRDYLREWLPWVETTQTEDDTRTFIRASLERFAAKGEIAAGIWFQGHYVGSVGTNRIDRSYQAVEIGYWIARAFQGRGIVTDACRAIIQHALGELEMNRIEIRCATGNAKSRAIPARLGFQHEGTLREAQWLNGRFHDLELYSMLKRDWKE